MLNESLKSYLKILNQAWKIGRAFKVASVRFHNTPKVAFVGLGEVGSKEAQFPTFNTSEEFQKSFLEVSKII